MKKIVFKMFEKMFVDFGNQVLETRKENRLIHEVLTYEITDADLQNFKIKL